MSEALLSVENLSIAFRTATGQIDTLHDVSFHLNRGEILGIVGESGSGKTLSCRAILQLLPSNALISSGQITFEGRDILSLRKSELFRLRGEGIAMIFQDPAAHLDPLMPVGKQIGEALRFHFGVPPREQRTQAIDLLHSVRIANPEQRVGAYPHELSGGMKQRVMIAAALACRPKILLADEPTTALDVTIQAGILKLLKQLRDEQDLSIIMVSHDLGVIADLCDRIVVMKDGRVVETGTTSEILSSPQEAYTRRLIESHPAMDVSAVEPGSESAAGERVDDSILRIDNLSVTFGQKQNLLGRALFQRDTFVQAVDGVSFSVQEGEKLGIVGESGSGKSTVARAIVKLVQPSGGQILYQGNSTGQMNGKALMAYRRAVQMVFQNPFSSLNPRMTVSQTLAEPLRKHRICEFGEVNNRVLALMESVEMPSDLLSRRPHELSGGQAQRVGIARALTLEPEILIADEITSALDVTIQAQILELLEQLCEQMNLTIIFISHDLGVVQQLCDNVVVMNNGQLVEYGRTDQILRNPHEDYTRQLIDAVPHIQV